MFFQLLLLTFYIVKSEKCFPKDFMFGTATAAYQVEGGWNLTQRTESIWDDFCRKRGLACANVADDMIHRYPKDMELMKKLGFDSYRFSISWSRVMRWNGSSMEENPKGIAFYHNVLQELKLKGIVPIVTMYHWDLPLKLHTELDPPGWLNKQIIQHFTQYARLLFREYGRHVYYWSTFNEPLSFVQGGYGYGHSAPGYSNSSTNAYVVAHHVLLSHGRVVQMFRDMKKKDMVPSQGKIGIVLNLDYGIPLDPLNMKDVEAVARYLSFSLGWYLNPIVHGEYPKVMREKAGKHLPKFTKEEAEWMKGSYDVFMLNHYSTKMVTDVHSKYSLKTENDLEIGWERDMAVDASRFPHGATPADTNREGKPNCAWFCTFPDGYLGAIRYIHSYNPSTSILLTENGYCGNASVSNPRQVQYYHDYLEQVWFAIQDNIPIIGYTAWSFLDNYEWGSFEPRFGLVYVDFPNATGSVNFNNPKPNELKRTPRQAALFMSQVTHSKCLPRTDYALSQFSKLLPENSWQRVSFGFLVGVGLIGFFAYISTRPDHQYISLNE